MGTVFQAGSAALASKKAYIINNYQLLFSSSVAPCEFSIICVL